MENIRKRWKQGKNALTFFSEVNNVIRQQRCSWHSCQTSHAEELGKWLPRLCRHGIDGSCSIYCAEEVTWNLQQHQEGAESSSACTPAGCETPARKRELGNTQSSSPLPIPKPQPWRWIGWGEHTPDPRTSSTARINRVLSIPLRISTEEMFAQTHLPKGCHLHPEICEQISFSKMALYPIYFTSAVWEAD